MDGRGFDRSSYLVALRRSEIGIRMALGAEPRGILFGVLGEGLVLCAVGLALGVFGGAAMARVIRNAFYGVQTIDPWVMTPEDKVKEKPFDPDEDGISFEGPDVVSAAWVSDFGGR